MMDVDPAPHPGLLPADEGREGVLRGGAAKENWMALSRGRRYEPVNYWPGFVDALSTMLLVIIFLLSVFMLAQFFLSREVTGKDEALARLNRQIEELTNLLALERTQKSTDQSRIATLTATLETAEREQRRLKDAAAESASAADAAGRAAATASALDAQKAISSQALAEVDVLNQQIAALRKQLAAIEDALAASEAANRESQSRISDLGQRLNVALAQKVQELNRYRSDFFGRLRQILGSRPDIRVVGDRFVFESSVLFDVGKADISAEGKQSLDTLASAVLDLEREIPPDIPWILRVDGHTDSKPITGVGQYRSNWELSAARAVAVVQYLVSRGVEPGKLAAAGFGEFQPIDAGADEASMARNRRIELKLTER
jgi:chemotaxis protein MotB